MLASEGLTTATAEPPVSPVSLVDVVSNRIFPVTTPVCRFGRDISNDIVLSGDKSLSRFHFQITLMDDEYFIEDAGSRNGTFLNGSPITAPRKILNGDIVSAGMSRYRFVLDGSEAVVAGANGDEITEVLTGETEAALAAPSNQAEELTGHAGNAEGKIESATHPAASQAKEVDPLTRIFQEGQALLAGKEDEENEPDLPGYFTPPPPDNGSHSAEPASKFIQLSRPEEPTIDELFEKQFPGALDKLTAPQNQAASGSSTAAASKTTAECDKPVHPLPVSTAESRPVDASLAAPVKEARGAWPAWCSEYSLAGLSELSKEISMLAQKIKQDEKRLQDLKDRLAKSADIKNHLLVSRSDELVDACQAVFETLGWHSQPNGAEKQELILSFDERAVAIVRIVCADAEPHPAEMAHLVSSLSNYWCSHGVEPKGIMLVSIMSNGPPGERPEFTREYADYSAKKNVCLMSTLQLLAIYGDTVLPGQDTAAVRTAILNASGQLPGFRLQHN